ncbi:MAG: diaminopimelate decarboxylase family protein [Planctomycetota bacterium]
MTAKRLPLDTDKLREIAAEYPTPFHIYDEKAIREGARRLQRAFAWNGGFREYFAVKATPNPYLLKILHHEGFGCDCSSLPELLLAERVGVKGEEVMFTSNDTPSVEFAKAVSMRAIVNLDDITHVGVLEETAGIPELISFRYNPGSLKQGNTIIGHPEEAKYGLTREQLFDAYGMAKRKGATRFGIHAMVASNELDPAYFVETADLLFHLAVELRDRLGIHVEFVNIGGGIGIPHEPGETPVDLDTVSHGIRERYQAVIEANGLVPPRLYMECGRAITGPYGYLVSKVRHIKKTYKNFAGLDACMANLMRPAMYGAYHHISVPGKEGGPAVVYDVTGSLCENNDKFAIDRALPELSRGDLVVIHDTGAHGHAMGFNYNGKLRSAELLLREDGSIKQIRRAETPDDYFATLDFRGLETFPV